MDRTETQNPHRFAQVWAPIGHPESILGGSGRCSSWQVRGGSAPRRIYGPVKAGKLRSLRIGNSIRFTPEEIERYATGLCWGRDLAAKPEAEDQRPCFT